LIQGLRKAERWARMKHTWALAMAVGLAIAAPHSARAQFGPPNGESLKALITGEVTATTKKLKELDANWRRITIGGSPSEGKGVAGGLGGFFGMMMGAAGGGQASASPAYFTQGTTVSVGQETFLITYRHQVKGLDFGALVAQAGPGGAPKLPEPEKLTADTDLQLTLVNVRSIQMISGIRAFNLDRELADGQKEFEAEITLRKQMEAGPFGGLGGAVAVPEPPMVEDMPAAPKPASKKPAPAKKPTPNRK
jgi:hypothetical protein